MRSVGPGTVYKCIGKINSVKHGGSLAAPFQVSLYRVYQSFRCLLHQSFRLLVSVTPVWLYVYT